MFTLRSTCGGNTRVFWGVGSPRQARGQFFDVPPGGQVSIPWAPGQSLWTMDSSGNGRASVTVPPGTGLVTILGNCMGIRLGM